MKFKIRSLKAEDLKQKSGFFETLSNLSGHINDYQVLDLRKRKAIWQKAVRQGAYFWVAESQAAESKGQIVSTVKLLVEPKFFYGGRNAGHIEDVATRQGFEGQGLAKALLKEALKKARKEKCYKVILDCKKSLIPFYKKSMFREEGSYMRLDFKK